METTQIRLKIDRHKLAWLKFVLESYEGLANCSTIDGAAGLVLVSIAPGAEKDIFKIVSSMENELGLEKNWGDLSTIL